MKTPHKHAALIKAWADGAEIESRPPGQSKWYTGTPEWDTYCEYRIKPEPKPDVVHLSSVVTLGPNAFSARICRFDGNLKLTFDGETGKLKAAEVIA